VPLLLTVKLREVAAALSGLEQRRERVSAAASEWRLAMPSRFGTPR